MCALELKVTLPDNLAREAEAGGLLTPQAIESLLRDEIRRRRVAKLFDAADRLASIDLPPMTESEIQAEIQAVRAERRAAHESLHMNGRLITETC